jgi:hypothetical protein
LFARIGNVPISESLEEIASSGVIDVNFKGFIDSSFDGRLSIDPSRIISNRKDAPSQDNRKRKKFTLRIIENEKSQGARPRDNLKAKLSGN